MLHTLTNKAHAAKNRAATICKSDILEAILKMCRRIYRTRTKIHDATYIYVGCRNVGREGQGVCLVAPLYERITSKHYARLMLLEHNLIGR